MISKLQWFTAKNGNAQPFTASVRREEKHYGKPFPVKRSWFRSNITYIIFLVSGVGAVVCFCATLLLTFYLLPAAIDTEIDRRLAAVEQSLGVSR
jgi:hypothetical protein